MKKRHCKLPGGTLLAVALSLVMACGLSACKPTDFFVEVVLSPFATTVDYDNPEKTVVNSPDAEEESADLSALQWTDESTRSEEVQNLVVYSSDPNSTLTTHHSIFDLAPLFSGIESSDAVRLSFDAEAELDHESDVDEWDASVIDAVSRSAGGESQESSQASSSEDAASAAAGGESEVGGNPDGDLSDPDNPGDDDGDDGDDGSDKNPLDGYDGTVNVYNPNDAFAKVNRVDHLAVLGGDAAVLAQSIGGENAICAMSESAYLSLDSSGVRTTSYACFSDVFADELADGFQQSALLWSNDGSSSGAVKDIDALVAACGQDGVIVYDQTLGSAETFFNLDQRKHIQAAGIQLVPVDLSTVQGILDAARVVGDALSESTELAQDASAMATTYVNAVNDIVKSVAATHGGALACKYQPALLTTKYNGVWSYQRNDVYSYIATDSETGLSYTDASVDASGIVLFGNNSTYLDTPLYFWQQAAGIWDNTNVSVTDTGLQVLWPLSVTVDATTLSGGRSGGAWSRWLGSNYIIAKNSILGKEMTFNEIIGRGHGLGSDEVPYLIVCASDGKSAGQVKSAVVASMASYSQNGVLTPYSALNYGSANGGTSSHQPYADGYTSTLGSTEDKTSYQSPFYSGLSLGDVVRENPVGLLGSWTEGTMESVLEAVWLADIYSVSPDGCDYDPVTHMGSFEVSIGGTTCTTTRGAVLAFYETFYRYDASGVYSGIVTDEGL